MKQKKIRELLSEMTLEEKIGLCVGKDFWHTKGVERLGIPSVMMTDGPHGLRKQEGAGDQLGLGISEKAVCFPAGCAIASSFQPQNAERIGEELGKIAREKQVGVVLGPALNIKRSPLCGRNFEYYSEDPLLSGKMAAAAVKGIQSQGIGACLKHFAVNNQEYFRQTQNSVVDEQTMREIYLSAFEYAVKEADPQWVMSSYNRINGTYASENREYLTDILREEWGFEGAVVSDWGASDDPAESIKAGMDLNMPGPAPEQVRQLKKAVEEGRLTEKDINRVAERILRNILSERETDRKGDLKGSYDFEAGHRIAAQVEEDSAVLLKNEDHILPLKEEEQVALIGAYVKTPRYQGGGSSHIRPWKVTSVWDEIGDRENISYAEGFREEGDEDASLLEQAVECAKAADKAVIFVGLPDAYETEAVDRKHLSLPENQNRLIQAVSKVQPNTAVVLHNGSPVVMPWLSEVKGVLELYLGGEAVGTAAARLLYGEVNPSGRLAESFPLRLEDTPCYPYYGVERDNVIYREGRLVGYRYYETMKRQVLFPFGHGLSYTSFSYSNLWVEKKQCSDKEIQRVRVDVTNTGDRAGKETVQLYVAPPAGKAVRPLRELRAFEKISLEPGECRTVEFILDRRAFAEWDIELHGWYVPGGIYQIQLGRSAAEIVLEKEIELISSEPKIPFFTQNTPLGEIMEYPKAKKILLSAMEEMLGTRATRLNSKDAADKSDTLSREAMLASAQAMPLRALLSFGADTKKEYLERILKEMQSSI